ncbi:hypothetical protein TBR22_A26640 [Luteitalea sp. TBR-22]|uniref:hypothetical protein n=1 Tax=Luteitalea sp. TBR-22 TaxID=2802971 RepID=UPI001AF32B13|nr:hypothetical protein [Luteitalea sp. TBR-22]BCS33437.1 hypothetical protein TBR22_A26640 [Luteitalea sp. TBR-22]
MPHGSPHVRRAGLSAARLVACVALAGSSATAQPAGVPVATVVRLPALDAAARLASPYAPDLSRDGRLVLWVDTPAAGATTQAWRVVDTTTGLEVATGTTLARTTSAPNVALSPDGRLLAFVAAAGGATELRVRDIVAATERVRLSGPSLGVEDITDAGVIVYVSGTQATAPTHLLTDDTTRALTNPCPARPEAVSDVLIGPARVTTDGSQVAYVRFWSAAGDGATPRPSGSDLVLAPLAGGSASCVTAGPTQDGRAIDLFSAPYYLNSAGTLAAVQAYVGTRGGWNLLVPQTREVRSPSPSLASDTVLGMSDDGRLLLVRRQLDRPRTLVLDRVSGLAQELVPSAGRVVATAALSADGRLVVFTTMPIDQGGTVTPASAEAFVARLDADGDNLHDAWETLFGLDTSTPSGALDPDNDGRTTAQEYAAGTHPLAAPVRYFAEGASGSFFTTSLALLNPTASAVTAVVTFLGPEGATASTPVSLAAGSPAYLDPDTLGLPFSEFSIVVEGPATLVAERRMAWDRARQYGSHSGTGVDQPRAQWHFAEGATIAGLQTFFLLQNPGDAPATVTMRYLLATGMVETRTHVVPARSRATVWVNQEGAPLNAAEFATTVDGSQPIVAERAMYRDAPGETFAAGSVASGVSAPATTWFFAEGATGPFFDTYLLLSNPATTPVTVSVEYDPAIDPADTSGAATPIARSYTLAPQSRRTIWVAQEAPALASTQVSARLTATAPIVAERTMWWPGPTAASWRENHTEIGATASGLAWGVADIPVEAAAGGWDTFLLVATTEPYLAQVRVDVVCSDGTRVSRTPNLLPQRTTLWMRQEFPEIVGKRCGATLTSLEHVVASAPSAPPRRVPIVVEVATYRGDFAAGGVSLATRLPE